MLKSPVWPDWCILSISLASCWVYGRQSWSSFHSHTKPAALPIRVMLSTADACRLSDRCGQNSRPVPVPGPSMISMQSMRSGLYTQFSSWLLAVPWTPAGAQAELYRGPLSTHCPPGRLQPRHGSQWLCHNFISGSALPCWSRSSMHFPSLTRHFSTGPAPLGLR